MELLQFLSILRDSTNTVCTIRLSSGTNNVTYKITSQITDSTGLVSELCNYVWEN